MVNLFDLDVLVPNLVLLHRHLLHLILLIRYEHFLFEDNDLHVHRHVYYLLVAIDSLWKDSYPLDVKPVDYFRKKPQRIT